jgi:hypothetical protein
MRDLLEDLGSALVLALFVVGVLFVAALAEGLI